MEGTFKREQKDFIEKIITVNRCAKVVKGGRRFSFSVLVVVGNMAGTVGIGMGKANEVPEAIRKATERAKKSLISVSLNDNTISHEIIGNFGAGAVLLKPASKGTGIIAGGPIRLILNALGVKDILTKCIGTNNPHNVIKATIDGLAKLRSAADVARMRGKSVEELDA